VNFVDAEWKEHEITANEAWGSIQAYLKVLEDPQDSDVKYEWSPLHMLAASPIVFPPVFYDIAIYYCREDMSKVDAEGRLSLHLACAQTSKADAGPDDSIFAHKLVIEYPQAAYKAATKSKRLPIHFAVEARKPLKLIAALLKAYPNSLNVKDPITRLWPFLLAASHSEDNVDTSYSLLRADPSILQLAISALISKSEQRAAYPSLLTNTYELEEHSHRRLRRLKIRENF
jgi:hypothetical protein